MDKKTILGKIKQVVSETISNHGTATLFGSRARGDNRSDSDWDILILLKKAGSILPSDIGRIAMPFYLLSAELGIEINPVIYTEEDWRSMSHDLFYHNVSNDGIKIWG